MHSISVILTFMTVIGFSTASFVPNIEAQGKHIYFPTSRRQTANPVIGLEARDITIVISDNGQHTSAPGIQDDCNDEACDDACYQKGGYIGGSCDSSGTCQCQSPDNSSFQSQGMRW